MPLSARRKKHGKPVRYTPPTPATAAGVAWDGLMTIDDVPPLQLRVRDTLSVPLFVGDEVNLYRMAFPAAAVGGRHQETLRIAIGNEPPRPLDLRKTAMARALNRAAWRGLPITVFGLSECVTVLRPGLLMLPVLAAFVAAVRVAGLPIWLDIDDDLLAIHDESALAELYGRVAADSIHPWLRAEWPELAVIAAEQRDEEFRQTVSAAARALFAAANGVVVSTEPLAATVRPHNSRVRVIPNGVDLDRYAQTPHRPSAYRDASSPLTDAPLAIGMTGHSRKWYHDLVLALPGLLAAARQPGVALHCFGGFPDEQRGRTPTQPGRYTLDGVPYRYHPPMPPRRYQREAGILDVAVLPLRPDIIMNRSRSGQKWMEMALHSTAVVAQRLEPYELAVENETCLKATETAEWTEQVLRLVSDARLRRRLGEAARAEVLAKHTMAARRPLWEALVAEASGGTWTPRAA